MVYDLQKAGLWKRIAAWMFDGILTAVLAVGLGFLLSYLLGYDSYSRELDAAYARYEQEYGIVFEITQEEYEAMTDVQKQTYQAASEALTADTEAAYAYNMMVNLSLVILSVSILLSVFLWEFAIPLYFGNGQTLGKKIFGLCLVRTDCVRMNKLQLFARTLLGKFTLETMLPVYIVFLSFWGILGVTGTVILFALILAQLLSLVISRTNSALHDLLAGTAVVDMASQMIFRDTEELIEFQKRVAAERAARDPY